MALKHPRCWVSAGDGRHRVEEATVTVHRFQSSDTFSAQFSMQDPSVSIQHWSDEAPIRTEILASNEESGAPSVLIKGYTDKVDFDWEHRTLFISGRDRTAEMLDKQTKEKWQDMTASDVVKDIAGRHGFSLHIDSTSDKAGKQYTQQHDLISDLENEWSVLVKLAEREGKVVYVKGDDLYFVAPGNQDAEGGTFAIRYSPPSPAGPVSSNSVRLATTRSVPMARPVKVTVRSFDRLKKKVITGEKEISGKGDKLEYEYSEPGLTQQEADAIAEKKATENTHFEREVTWEGPGDANIDPRMMLTLSGTGTSFDQKYFIDSVSHRFGGHGHEMIVHAKDKDSRRG